jgi:hypothetical protein
VEPLERSEMIDIDTERFISLEYSREWPKYVVSWWVRQRLGESDFPLAEGRVDRLPSSAGQSLDELWEQLRQAALDQAMTAATSSTPAQGEKQKGRSILDRLFGRR